MLAEKNDEENPASVHDIKKHILQEQEKERKVLDELPDSVNVGLFEISMSEARSMFARKHNAISTALLKLLDTRYKDQAEFVISEFSKIKLKLKKPPADVEELTELKE